MGDRYAVIGNPVAHSKSPLIHAAFARATGQDLDYGLIEAPLDGFAAAVARFRAGGGRGLNVTLPFKQEAFGLCDRVSERARIAQAVNTLVLGNRFRRQHRRHRSGARPFAKLEARIRRSRVLLMGAGGAAQGVVGALLEAGADRAGDRQPHRVARRGRWPRAFPARRASRLRRTRGAHVRSGDQRHLRRPGRRSAAAAGRHSAQRRRSATTWSTAARRRFSPRRAAPARAPATASACWSSRPRSRSSSGAGVRPDTAPVLAKLRGGVGGFASLIFAWKAFCYTLGTAVLAVIGVQLWFFSHIMYWSSYNPSSTAFMERYARAAAARSRCATSWVPYARISEHLKRAVVAAEDAKFLDHEGFDWEAIQKAMEKNEQRGQSGGRRLDHQPAAGEEPVPFRRALVAAQGPGGDHHLDAGAHALQAPHPRDLPQLRGVGRRRVRRRGGCAPPLRRAGGRPRPRSRRPGSPPSCPARGATTAGGRPPYISGRIETILGAHDGGANPLTAEAPARLEVEDLQENLRAVQALLQQVEPAAKQPTWSSCAQQTSTARSQLPADIAAILEALPLEERLVVWDLVKADRDGEILVEVSDAVRESLIATMDSRSWSRRPRRSRPTSSPTSRRDLPPSGHRGGGAALSHGRARAAARGAFLRRGHGRRADGFRPYHGARGRDAGSGDALPAAARRAARAHRPAVRGRPRPGAEGHAAARAPDRLRPRARGRAR